MLQKLRYLALRLVRGNRKPMPWEHGPAFQIKVLNPRDEYGRWIIDGGEPNDWNYGNQFDETK